MTPEQRQQPTRLLEGGGEICPESACVLFSPEKREYGLVYHGKEREEDIIADALAVPLESKKSPQDDPRADHGHAEQEQTGFRKIQTLSLE